MLSTIPRIRLSPGFEDGGSLTPSKETRARHLSADQFRAATTQSFPHLLRLLSSLDPNPGNSWFHESFQFISLHGVSAPTLYSLCLLCNSQKGEKVLGGYLQRRGVSLESNQIVETTLLYKLPLTGFRVSENATSEEAAEVSTGKLRKQTSLWVPAGNSLLISTELLSTHVAEIAEPGTTQSSALQRIGSGLALSRSGLFLSYSDRIRTGLLSPKKLFLGLQTSSTVSVNLAGKNIDAKRSVCLSRIAAAAISFSMSRLSPSRFDPPPHDFACAIEKCVAEGIECLRISNYGPAALFVTFERDHSRSTGA